MLQSKIPREQIIFHSIIQSSAVIYADIHFYLSPYTQNYSETWQSDLPLELKLFYTIGQPLCLLLTPISIVDSIADIITGEYHYLPKRLWYAYKARKDKDFVEHDL